MLEGCYFCGLCCLFVETFIEHPVRLFCYRVQEFIRSPKIVFPPCLLAYCSLSRSLSHQLLFGFYPLSLSLLPNFNFHSLFLIYLKPKFQTFISMTSCLPNSAG